jgi:uncharacterized protein (DUF1330 family)
MKALQQNRSLSDIAAKPTFRIIDGVSIRFVESDPENSDALLLSPGRESVFAYEPTWPRLAETTHLVAIDLPGDRPGVRTSGHWAAHEAGLQQRTIVVEFDSYEIVLAAHKSAAYQKALQALGSAAERDFRIVEGA